MMKMKRVGRIAILLFVWVFAGRDVVAQIVQTPKGILFQASITDGKGNSASGRKVYIQDAIVQKTANGKVVYSETFQVTASEQGLVTIVVGQGTRISGAASIADIDWSAGPYFFSVKAAVAPASSAIGWDPSQNYVDLGTSPFWAVPYALYAAKVEGMDKKLNIADTAAMLKPYADNKNVVFATGVNGLVPAPGSVRGRYLADNGQWLPILDTVLLNSRINRKLDAADTVSLSNRILAAQQSLKGHLEETTSGLAVQINAKLNTSDTVGLNTRIRGKLSLTDTAAMLSGYARAGQSVRYADTASMLSGYAKAGRSVQYSDTASMLLNRLKISDTTVMLSGYAKNGQSVRYADTASMLSGYAKSGRSVQYSDTASMLLNRLKASDTTSMLSGYAKNGQSVRYSDTSSMLLNRLKVSDTTSMLSGYARAGQSVRYADTASMLSGYAKAGRSVQYSDTASMLLNRLKVSDTTFMLSGYTKNGQSVR
ncbi:MAG: hypothetical protein IM598_07560 [Chitinophagaceae bacterium]|nr:hypothetical protein [Chitinophagaceae bacterium]